MTIRCTKTTQHKLFYDFHEFLAQSPTYIDSDILSSPYVVIFDLYFICYALSVSVVSFTGWHLFPLNP